jgi:ElaB/YqjD/DUF883 family membrane-anchored ribosome-binding protein
VSFDRSQTDQREQGAQYAEQTGDRAREYGDRGGAMASEAGERVQETAQQAGEQAREMADRGGEMAAEVGRQAQDSAQRAAGYLRTHDTSEIVNEVEHYVQEHPLQSVAFAVGAGFLVGRMLR